MAQVLFSIFFFFEKDLHLNAIEKYVDGIRAAFDNEQDSLNFLNFLNNRHRNIKFTKEKQLTIPLLFFANSFQVSIIKISHFKHITNRPIQDFS